MTNLLNEKILNFKREMDELQKMTNELTFEMHIEDALKTGDMSRLDEFFNKRAEIETKVKDIQDRLVELQHESQCEARVNSEFAYPDLIKTSAISNLFLFISTNSLQSLSIASKICCLSFSYAGLSSILIEKILFFPFLPVLTSLTFKFSII